LKTARDFGTLTLSGLGENYALGDFRHLIDFVASRIQPQHRRELDSLASCGGPGGLGDQFGEWPTGRNLDRDRTTPLKGRKNHGESGTRKVRTSGMQVHRGR
jgi:hypothetical protein